MRADYAVVLDSCVLIPMPLADTLLRMAEEPRLYIPRWSHDILSEVGRNLVVKLGRTEAQADHRCKQMDLAFPSASVHHSYRSIIPNMPEDIHEKDRHVVAAALRCNCELIVTYNKKDFPQSVLSDLGVTVLGPSSFLISLYDLEPAIVIRKLTEQAQAIGQTFEQLLDALRLGVPTFVSYIREELAVGIAPVLVSRDHGPIH